MIHRDHHIKIPLQGIMKNRVTTQRANNVESAFLRGENRRRDDFYFFIAKLPAFARVRIQAANGHTRTRQLQITARLRGQLDGEFNFRRCEFFRDGFERNVNCGQRDAQPASALVVAEQHHRGAFGAGEFGEKFSLAGEFVSGTDDGFLVDRRGDERVQFVAEAAFGAITQ